MLLCNGCMYKQALEEEIEGLKAELVNSELANDELNLELQELQERELARCEYFSFRHTIRRRWSLQG